MSLDQAIELSRSLRHSTPESLNDEQRHQLVHDITHVIALAIKMGVITYAEYERRASS